MAKAVLPGPVRPLGTNMQSSLIFLLGFLWPAS